MLALQHSGFLAIAQNDISGVFFGHSKGKFSCLVILNAFLGEEESIQIYSAPWLWGTLELKEEIKVDIRKIKAALA